MLLVWIGALLIVIGVLLSATTTIRRGRLSDAEPPPAGDAPDTLEPKGRGRRLSLKADVPGIALFVIGAAFQLAAALTAGPR